MGQNSFIRVCSMSCNISLKQAITGSEQQAQLYQTSGRRTQSVTELEWNFLENTMDSSWQTSLNHRGLNPLTHFEAFKILFWQLIYGTHASFEGPIAERTNGHLDLFKQINQSFHIFQWIQTIYTNNVSSSIHTDYQECWILCPHPQKRLCVLQSSHTAVIHLLFIERNKDGSNRNIIVNFICKLLKKLTNSDEKKNT